MEHCQLPEPSVGSLPLCIHYLWFILKENSVAVSIFITMLYPSIHFFHSALYLQVPSIFYVYLYFIFLAV